MTKSFGIGSGSVMTTSLGKSQSLPSSPVEQTLRRRSIVGRLLKKSPNGAFPAPLPLNERERLRALHRLDILDTLPEISYDDIVTIAAHTCGTSASAVSLIDEERQWFKAKLGIDVCETGRDVAFCAHAIHYEDIMEVPDALLDERFNTNPLVVGGPHIRFYAGVPLSIHKKDGTQQTLGTLCVLDTVPHTLTAAQKNALSALGRLVVSQIENRRQSKRLQQTINDLNISEDAYQEVVNYNESLITFTEELQEKTDELERRMSLMMVSSETNNTVNTPAEDVINTLQQLKKNIMSFAEKREAHSGGALEAVPASGDESGTMSQAMRDLDHITEIIASQKLYTPDLPNILENDKTLDRQTKRFLMAQLTRDKVDSELSSDSSSPNTSPDASPVVARRSKANVARNAQGLSNRQILQQLLPMGRTHSGHSTTPHQPFPSLATSRSSHALGPIPPKASSNITRSSSFSSSATSPFNQCTRQTPLPDIEAARSAFANISSWDFNIFTAKKLTQGHPLLFSTYFALEQHNLIDKFELDKTKLLNFLVAIEGGYINSNTYHNSTHASDVVLGCNFFITRAPQWQEIDPLEKLATLLAAAVHDFRHPGITNAFLINVGHDLAIRHNDVSVLENHHCAEAFAVLGRPEFDFLGNIQTSDRQRLRRMIIDMVLATDMARHLEIIGQFQTKIAASGLDLTTKEDRSLLQRMTIKCADISNPTKTLHLCQVWADRVLEEFYTQGDLEKTMNMPVTAFMDRAHPTPEKCQIGFISYIVLPTFKLWTSFVQTPELLKNLEDNLEHWKAAEERKLHAGSARS